MRTLRYGWLLPIAVLWSTQPLWMSTTQADVIVLGPTQDTRLYQQQANTPEGSLGIISVYHVPGNNQRSLLQFDIGSLPANQQIDSAILTLYASTFFGNNPSNLPMTVHQVTKAWTESSVTWNSAAAGDPWSTAGGDFLPTVVGTSSANPGNFQPVTWDVTGLVQSWYAGNSPNHGMLLQSPSGNQLHFSSREASSASLRPTLSVTLSAVPEPSSLLLCGPAAVGISLRRRRVR